MPSFFFPEWPNACTHLSSNVIHKHRETQDSMESVFCEKN